MYAMHNKIDSFEPKPTKMISRSKVSIIFKQESRSQKGNENYWKMILVTKNSWKVWHSFVGFSHKGPPVDMSYRCPLCHSGFDERTHLFRDCACSIELHGGDLIGEYVIIAFRPHNDWNHNIIIWHDLQHIQGWNSPYPWLWGPSTHLL